MQSIYDFNIEGVDGEEIDFNAYRGKKIILVNVASECGFTYQYAQLQELYENFKNKLVIIACPCNDFGGQEPGSNREIEKFCVSNYDISFPVTSKMKIIDDPHPLFQFLTDKKRNGVTDHEVRWNFHKFLIDEQGRITAAYPSAVEPASPEIINWITSAQV